MNEIDNQITIEELDEGRWVPRGSSGGYIEVGKKRIDVDHDCLLSKSDFAATADEIGGATKFAWDHQYGLETLHQSKFSKAEWLGKDSYYDKSRFFFITGLEEKIPELLQYEKYDPQKGVAAILRISNHITDFGKWERVQGAGKEANGGNRTINNDLSCDFGLTLIFDKERKKVDDKGVEVFRTTVIDCDCMYYDFPEGDERIAQIDNLVKKINSGERPTISYSTIETFGLCKVRTSVPKNDPDKPYRDENFTNTSNRTVQIINAFPFKPERKAHTEPEVEKPKEVPVTSIAISDMPFGIKDKEVFVYKGKQYVYDEDNMCAYIFRGYNRENKPIFNPKKPIPLYESIKIGMKDIMEMVERVLKSIL